MQPRSSKAWIPVQTAITLWTTPTCVSRSRCSRSSRIWGIGTACEAVARSGEVHAPLHGAEREHSRSFAVNVSKNVYRCFHAECAGRNVLDFWAAAHNLSLYKAALDMAETFQLETTRNREEGARNTKPKTTLTRREKLRRHHAGRHLT